LKRIELRFSGKIDKSRFYFKKISETCNAVVCTNHEIYFLPSQEALKNFDAFWNLFDKNYATFEEKGID